MSLIHLKQFPLTPIALEPNPVLGTANPSQAHWVLWIDRGNPLP